MAKETDSARLEEDLRSTSTELLAECNNQADAARGYAINENAYRMAKAKAYLNSEGTVDARKAQVDMICERERLAAHISEGILDSTRERVRSLRAVLSALQTISAVHRVEADLDRTGPR